MKVPERIEQGARKRVQQAEDQRQRVYDATRKGRPLDAEPDEDRKMKRLQAITSLNPAAAEKLAKYGAPVSFGLTGERRLGAERIQGKTVDFVGVSFLELAVSAARAVGRVVFRSLAPQGSGFLVSNRLFLTNNHVIPSKADASQFLVEFNYELDIQGRPKAVTRFEFDPETFFITNSSDDLDFTVIAIGKRLSGNGQLSDFGFCPLIATEDKHVLGEFLNVIQHPEGDYKQVVIRENQIVSRFETVLHYEADTMPGSSGSPVYNDQWEAVALHHWGEPYRETQTPAGVHVRKDVNEGVRISAIVRALQKGKQELQPGQAQLLQSALSEALKLDEKEKPIEPVLEPERVITEEEVKAFEREPEVKREVEATGTKWTIPIEVSIQLGSPGQAQAAKAVVPEPRMDQAAFEKVKIDPKYSNRNGYNPKFLSGFRIDLPELNEDQMMQVARKLQMADGEHPFELKYQHFSIVVNAARRMAFFTAVNIDGPTWIHIDRDTGEPKDEASEVWYIDPRISEKEQCDQSLYSNQLPKRVFDRGHLVRRQDPAWGIATRAKRANADTFHFTNCAPQQWQFNEHTEYWQGIENYILDNAKADDERVIVFTGPVFASDDPKYRYVRVPMQFWKILVRVDDGQLLATALLADQSERIKKLPEMFQEGFSDLGDVAEYQTSVAEIENLTGLDFAELRDHDTFQPGPEEAISKKRRIKSFETIRLDPR